VRRSLGPTCQPKHPRNVVFGPSRREAMSTRMSAVRGMTRAVCGHHGARSVRRVFRVADSCRMRAADGPHRRNRIPGYYIR
jgi:hypothetical protein